MSVRVSTRGFAFSATHGVEGLPRHDADCQSFLPLGRRPAAGLFHHWTDCALPFNMLRMARCVLQRIAVAADLGMSDLSTQDTTLGMLLARYTRLKILAEPTRARYCLVARNLARCLAGETAVPDDLALSRLTPDALLRFREWSLQRMRPVSFNTERRHLSALFNMAVRNGSLPRNPFAEVPGAPLQKLLPRSLPKDGIGRYIDYLATAHRLDSRGRRVDIFQPQWFWLAVVRTFYFTGMRKRQLLGLVWDDIDFSAKTIRLGADSSKTRRE